MKKAYQVILCIVLMAIVFLNINIVLADSTTHTSSSGAEHGSSSGDIGGSSASFSVDGMFSDGSTWFGNMQQQNSTDGIVDVLSDVIGTKGSGGIIDAVFQVGNVIFVATTMILGIKYALSSSIEGKSDIKESLTPLVIGAIFFYLAQTIFNFVKGIVGGFSTASSIGSITGKLFSSIASIANIVAIGSVIIMGLRYMFTASDEKARLKEQMLPLIIGLAMIYSGVQILNFIVNFASSIIS